LEQSDSKKTIKISWDPLKFSALGQMAWTHVLWLVRRCRLCFWNLRVGGIDGNGCSGNFLPLCVEVG